MIAFAKHAIRSVPAGAIALPLSNGGSALIDARDFERTIEYEVWPGAFFEFRVCDSTWRRKDKYRLPYIQTCTSRSGRQCCVRLHRLILNAPHGRFVDHINRDVTDNRRENLRLTDVTENNRNRSLESGVIWDASRGLWIASLHYRGKWHYLGDFHDHTLAVQSRTELLESFRQTTTA